MMLVMCGTYFIDSLHRKQLESSPIGNLRRYEERDFGVVISLFVPLNNWESKCPIPEMWWRA
jgi:hypothetical protein